jgi:hypothetical protein
MSGSDAKLRYTLEAKPVHETLRRALLQLSGLLLKRLTHNGGGFVDVAPAEAARASLEEAADNLRMLPAPAAAAHNRFHLLGAATALERGVAAAMSRADPAGDALFRWLDEAERHLRAAGRALPGFESVDLTQACCAAHGRSATFAFQCAD